MRSISPPAYLSKGLTRVNCSAYIVQKTDNSVRAPSRETSFQPSAAVAQYVKEHDQYKAFLVGAVPPNPSKSGEMCRVTHGAWERMGGDKTYVESK